MPKPTVAVIKDNVIEAIWICSTADDAETRFLDECSRRISSWDEYNQDDIDAVLDDGYEKFGNGSVCLSWAEVLEQ